MKRITYIYMYELTYNSNQVLKYEIKINKNQWCYFYSVIKVVE